MLNEFIMLFWCKFLKIRVLRALLNEEAAAMKQLVLGDMCVEGTYNIWASNQADADGSSATKLGFQQ